MCLLLVLPQADKHQHCVGRVCQDWQASHHVLVWASQLQLCRYQNAVANSIDVDVELHMQVCGQAAGRPAEEASSGAAKECLLRLMSLLLVLPAIVAIDKHDYSCMKDWYAGFHEIVRTGDAVQMPTCSQVM